MTPAELARMAAPLVALLLPGWSITWEVCAPEDIGGNLAMIYPTPTRSMALVKVAPHPPGESPLESIAHELVHGVLSPLTALLPADHGAIMLEEQAVERLGVALAKLPVGLSRAVGRAVEKYAPRMRARVSARASRSRKGRAMDPKILMEALDALIAGDTAKCAEILKALVASAAGGAAEPDGDEAPPAREDAPPGDAPPAAPPARGYGRDEEPPMARGRRALDVETARARKGADLAVATGIRGRLREVRAEGLNLDAKLEAELAAMRDPDRFEQRIADLMRGRELAAPGQQRARSGVQVDGAPAPTGDNQPPMTAAQLAAEGFDPAFVAGYQAEHKADPRAAAATLSGGRAARARKAGEEAAMRARAARDAGRGN